MNTIKEFVDFINNLENENVPLYQGLGLKEIPFRTINLKTLTIDIENFDTLESWLKNKNLTDHLKNNIIITILNTNPPENVRNEFISFMI